MSDDKGTTLETKSAGVTDKGHVVKPAITGIDDLRRQKLAIMDQLDRLKEAEKHNKKRYEMEMQALWVQEKDFKNCGKLTTPEQVNFFNSFKFHAKDRYRAAENDIKEQTAKLKLELRNCCKQLEKQEKAEKNLLKIMERERKAQEERKRKHAKAQEKLRAAEEKKRMEEEKKMAKEKEKRLKKEHAEEKKRVKKELAERKKREKVEMAERKKRVKEEAAERKKKEKEEAAARKKREKEEEMARKKREKEEKKAAKKS